MPPSAIYALLLIDGAGSLRAQAESADMMFRLGMNPFFAPHSKIQSLASDLAVQDLDANGLQRQLALPRRLRIFFCFSFPYLFFSLDFLFPFPFRFAFSPGLIYLVLHHCPSAYFKLFFEWLLDPPPLNRQILREPGLING